MYNTQKIWGHRAFFRVMNFRTWPPSEDFDKMTTALKNSVKSKIIRKLFVNTHYFNLNISLYLQNKEKLPYKKRKVIIFRKKHN